MTDTEPSVADLQARAALLQTARNDAAVRIADARAALAGAEDIAHSALVAADFDAHAKHVAKASEVQAGLDADLAADQALSRAQDEVAAALTRADALSERERLVDVLAAGRDEMANALADAGAKVLAAHTAIKAAQKVEIRYTDDYRDFANADAAVAGSNHVSTRLAHKPVTTAVEQVRVFRDLSLLGPDDIRQLRIVTQ